MEGGALGLYPGLPSCESLFSIEEMLCRLMVLLERNGFFYSGCLDCESFLEGHNSN